MTREEAIEIRNKVFDVCHSNKECVDCPFWNTDVDKRNHCEVDYFNV